MNDFMPGAPADALPPEQRPPTKPRRTGPKVALGLFTAVVAAVVAAGVAGVFQPLAQPVPASAAPTAPATAGAASRPAPTTTRAVPVPSRDPMEVVYTETVRGKVYSAAVYSDAQLVSIANLICTNLDTHNSVYGVIGTVTGVEVKYGFTQGDAAYIVGSAVTAICPRHLGIVQEAS